VFPVMYELNTYIVVRKNSVFKGLILHKVALCTACVNVK
jgi:hypothetical protein